MKKHLKFGIDLIREQPTPSLIHVFLAPSSSMSKGLSGGEGLKRGLMGKLLSLAYYAVSNADVLYGGADAG